jgi:dynein heavy chain 1, cytosolic
MKNARSLIENSQTEKSFGPLVVEYAQIQGKVNLKYDAWQKEFQGRFGGILADVIRETNGKLSAAKSRLEAVTLEGPSKDVIVGVTFIQEMRQQRQAFQATVELLEAGEKLLLRQRYSFSADWPQVSNVVGALDDFTQILDRRASAMEEQIPLLQQKVRSAPSSLRSDMIMLTPPVRGGCAGSGGGQDPGQARVRPGGGLGCQQAAARGQHAARRA